MHEKITRISCIFGCQLALVPAGRGSDTLESQDEATVMKRVLEARCRYPAKTVVVQTLSRMDLLTEISDIFAKIAVSDLRIPRNGVIPLP